ncbi:unnamed protein product [Heligmosomoides polygyrus]|uniref:DDE_Tnp_1_7 domain-containing protein n=1 Tax=Heligmosomoides polygyrus TaxID=6339 RepID=A0A183FLX4_HELPZ|nr:unnamed protein product [Heligmosomoides polygyrus]
MTATPTSRNAGPSRHHERTPLRHGSLKDAGISYHGKYRATTLWNNIVRQFREEMPTKRHRRQLTSFDDSFTGKEAVDFLMILLPRLIFEGRQVDRWVPPFFSQLDYTVHPPHMVQYRNHRTGQICIVFSNKCRRSRMRGASLKGLINAIFCALSFTVFSLLVRIIRIKDGATQSLLGCATHSTSTGCRGGDLSAYSGIH